jgi:ankyrin repeat protein
MRHAPIRLRLRALLVVGALAGCSMTSPPAGRDRPASDAGPTIGQAPPAQLPLPEDTSRRAGEAVARDGSLEARLIAAAGAGDLPSMRRLLAEGAGVAVRGQQGRTALVAAAYGNHLRAAQLLLDAGADVDAKDDTQQNLYLIATSEVGDDPRLLALALAAGADPHAKDSYNGTGLIRAADRGHPRITSRLLRAGVDADHVNRLGWTALLEAVILGDGRPRYVETVRLLLGGGADPRLSDKNGVTPAAHAERRRHETLAGMLRAAEKDP